MEVEPGAGARPADEGGSPVVDMTSVRGAEDFFSDDFFADPSPTYRSFRDVDPVYELPFDLNLEQAQMVAGASPHTWLVTGSRRTSKTAP